MKYRRLGRTGLAVSPITLGTMAFGPPMSESQAEQVVRTAIDLGINILDTANCYDGPHRGDVIEGHAERMLGKVLSSSLRDDIVLVSKVGVPLRAGAQHRGLSATHILRELDNSLHRLNTDYLDVYLIHWPDAFAHPEEVLRAINWAEMSGKVRYFGISNHLAWQVCEYLWIADRRNWPTVGVSEIPMSLLQRRYENDLPFYERHEIGILAYQALEAGFLVQCQDDRAALISKPSAESRHDNASEPRTQAREVIALNNLANEAGIALSELAIAWAVNQPAVTSVVLGARSAEHMLSALRATEFSISLELRERINKISPPPQPPQARFER